MKQTAVEWLADNIMPMIPFHTLEYRNNFIKFIEQAKAMEKEQIIKTAQDNFYIGQDLANDYEIDIKSAEKYFDKTFKSE